MKKLYSPGYLVLALALFFGAALMVPVGALAEDLSQGQIKNEAVADTPVVTLQRWQNAEENERYAFLVGFVTMLDIEHSWQGDNPRPSKESIIG